MPQRFKIANLALGVMFALSANVARADFLTNVTETVTPQAGGEFLYSYTVSNLPTSTFNIGEFDLNVSTDAALSSIKNPIGFLALYTTGDSFISFASTDPTTDITASSSGVFSFQSLDTPGLQDNLVRSFDGTSPSNGGQTLAPLRAVPEPASLALCGLGAVCFAGFLFRSRARAS